MPRQWALIDFEHLAFTITHLEGGCGWPLVLPISSGLCQCLSAPRLQFCRCCQNPRARRALRSSEEGSNVVDCGHSYCFGRSRSGGPLRVFGTGLPNGRTEFPIGRSIGRTPIGKVRTTIKSPLPHRESPGPNRAKVPFYTGRVRLSFRTVRIRPDT